MQTLLDTLIWLPAILIGLTFHEYAHGKVADLLGDPTPMEQGRLTLNPLPHLDWLGFFMLLIFKFGWAKPVQVNPFRFRDTSIKRGMMLVSLAGPGINLLIALVGMILYRVFLPYQGYEWGYYAVALIQPLVDINLILAAFNLIPIPPLDGSKILAGILPDAGTRFMYSLEQYGTIILLFFIITGVAGKIFIPLAQLIKQALYALVFFTF